MNQFKMIFQQLPQLCGFVYLYFNVDTKFSISVVVTLNLKYMFVNLKII